MTHTDQRHEGLKRPAAVSRRNALKMALGVAGLVAVLGSPIPAYADEVSDATAAANSAADQLAATKQALGDAQAQYDAISGQLAQLQNDYSALAKQQADTLTKIEGVQKQIDATQADIDVKQKDLDKKRAVLSARMSSSYKAGGDNFLSILLNSSSFESLFQNVYYLDKITESDTRMIQEVKTAKDALDAQKASLEKQKSQLDDLNQEQQKQMEQMSAKQQEVSSLLASANDSVQKLLAQKDADLVAYNNAETARQQAEAARNASRGGGWSGGGGGGWSGGGWSGGGGSGSASAVINACHSTPSPGVGWCAAWVSYVFRNAGIPDPGGNACDMYAAWCTSSDRSQLKPGMIVAVSTHNLDPAGRIYGHVGIYVGGGQVMDNIGYIRTCSIDSWISQFGGVVPVRWGWLGGTVLS